MTGICAIYSSLAQTRQPILSLTSTAIRGSSQIHVRQNSVLTCAHNNTSIVKPASSLIRTAPALSHHFNVQLFGGSFLTVSINN